MEVEAGVVELPVDMHVETEVFQLSADMEVEAEVVELPDDMQVETEVFQLSAGMEVEAEVVELPVDMQVETEVFQLSAGMEVEAEVVELPVDMQVETEVFQLSADMEVEAEVVELSADMEVEATTMTTALDSPCHLSTEIDDMGMAFKWMELSTEIDDIGLALEDMKLETGDEEMEAEDEQVDATMEHEEPASLAPAPPFAPQVDMEVEPMLITTMEPDRAPTHGGKTEMEDATMDDDHAIPLAAAPFAPPVEMHVEPMLLTPTDAENANTVNAQPIVPSLTFTAPSEQIDSVLPPQALAVANPPVFKLHELPPECPSRSTLDSRFLQVPATPTPRGLMPSTSDLVFKVPEVFATPTPQARTSPVESVFKAPEVPATPPAQARTSPVEAVSKVLEVPATPIPQARKSTVESVFKVPAVPKRLLPNMVKRSAPSPMMHPALQAVAPWAATRQVPAAADVVKLGISAVYPPVNQVTAAKRSNAMVETDAPALIPTQPQDPFILARKVKAAPKRTNASREARVAAAVAQAQAQAPPIPEVDWNDLSNFDMDSPAGLLVFAEAMARAPPPPMDEAIAAGPFYADPVTGEIRVIDDDYSGTGLDGTAVPFGLGNLPTFDNSVVETANNDTSSFVVFDPSTPGNPVGEPVTNVALPPEA